MCKSSLDIFIRAHTTVVVNRRVCAALKLNCVKSDDLFMYLHLRMHDDDAVCAIIIIIIILRYALDDVPAGHVSPSATAGYIRALLSAHMEKTKRNKFKLIFCDFIDCVCVCGAETIKNLCERLNVSMI